MLQEELGRHGFNVDQLQLVMVAENVEAIGVAVEHGLGIAFVPRLAAKHGLRSGSFVEASVEELRLERPLYIMRNSRRPAPAALRQFWDFVRVHQEQISQILDG